MCLGQLKKKSFQWGHIIEKDMIRKIQLVFTGQHWVTYTWKLVSALYCNIAEKTQIRTDRSADAQVLLTPANPICTSNSPSFCVDRHTDSRQDVGKRVRALRTPWGNCFESHTHNTFIKRSPTHKYQLNWSDWSLLILYRVPGCGQRSAVGPLARLLLPSGF